MNTLFIDISNLDSKTKAQKKFSLSNIKYKAKTNILKYELVEDFLKNGTMTNNISLKINKDILENIANNKKNIRRLYFENDLKNRIKNIDKLNIVFSNYFENENGNIYKNYIVNTLKKKREDLSLKEILIDNKMSNHLTKYIDDYVKEHSINQNKLKILAIFNDINDYSEDKLKEYILRYKFIDVLRMNGINKIDYKKLSTSIDELNYEFGSTIDIIQRRNIQEYNIYLMFSKVKKEDFYSHYILRKKSKYIDLNNADDDIYNENIKLYKRNKYELSTLFNRLELSDDNFSKNKLGALILEDMNLKLDR